jgi:chromate transporter
MQNPTRSSPAPSMADLFLIFLRIGSVAFGGFMALVSVIETEVVERRKLLRHEDMLDGISLANLLPGPLAVNVVAYVGYRLRGGRGALAAATGVLLPSFLLLLVLTELYFRFGDVATLTAVFAGITPAIAAVIGSVAWRMGGKNLTGAPERTLAALSALTLLAIPREVKLATTFAIIGVCAAVGLALFRRGGPADEPAGSGALPVRRMAATFVGLAALAVVSTLPLDLDPQGLPRLGLTFGGLSVMLFGGGFVMIPMIQDVVVTQYGWLTDQQFIDGIALGQVTPGPILISATFIGQAVAGFSGALVATVAIFAPPAVLMVTASEGLEFLKRSPRVAAALRGIRCGVIGMILTAAWVVLRSAAPDGPQDLPRLGFAALVFVGSLAALVRWKLDVVWVIPSAGIAGLLFSFLP